MPLTERKNNNKFDAEFFDCEHAIIALYLNTTGTYITISIAALAFSAAFVERVTGLSPTDSSLRNPLLVACWVSFSVATLAGAFYQYVAVKHLDQVSLKPGPVWGPIAWAVDSPGLIYFVMLISFYGGVISLAGLALTRIWT